MKRLLFLLLWSAAALGGVSVFAAERRVVISIDDLPGVHDAGSCSVETLTRLNRDLVAAVKRNRVPALGLVVESRSCAPDALPSLFRIWLDAGLTLGNHTASHRDFNRTPLEEYEADTLAGEKTLRALGKPPRYFRYPFLRSGTELPKKRAFESWLREHGYTNAPVTIDNDEYIYAMAYSRATDAKLKKRIADDYLRYMESIFAFYESLSREVLDRELPQILLIHDNRLNADTFDRLIAMMRKRGYRFIPIEEALRDPAYARQDAYIGRRGLSWLHRWAMDDGKPQPPVHPEVPEWVNAVTGVR